MREGDVAFRGAKALIVNAMERLFIFRGRENVYPSRPAEGKNDSGEDIRKHSLPS